MKIVILTRPPKNFFTVFSFYLIDWAKNLAKEVLFIPNYGPEAVLGSLIRGFKILKVDYQLNPPARDISDIVCVVSGVNALRWAIEAKKQGKIKKIIAGPNLVITPEDAGGILLDEVIDLVIVPSQWVKDFYASFDKTQNNADINRPQNSADTKQKDADSKQFQRDSACYQRNSVSFKDKIRVWPAGVEICPESKEKREGCLIYKKNVDENLFNFILKYLKSQNINYKIIEYGRYKKEKYFEILNKVKFMIYLSESESQGLALQEAWIRNVPTLVWDGGYWQCGKYKWQGSSSAPYLTKDCGMFFKGKEDFINKFETFLKNLPNFQPREYSLENFTDETATKNYLKIINDCL